MKSILLSAKVLNKSEQKSVNGGLKGGDCRTQCSKPGVPFNGKNCGSAACGNCIVVCS
ncbi:MAG: hypothetical protein WBP45_08660 [Daejeonella sp.]